MKENKSEYTLQTSTIKLVYQLVFNKRDMEREREKKKLTELIDQEDNQK